MLLIIYFFYLIFIMWQSLWLIISVIFFPDANISISNMISSGVVTQNALILWRISTMGFLLVILLPIFIDLFFKNPKLKPNFWKIYWAAVLVWLSYGFINIFLKQNEIIESYQTISNSLWSNVPDYSSYMPIFFLIGLVIYLPAFFSWKRVLRESKNK